MSAGHPFLRDLLRELVLASQSPRRADILRAQRVTFTIQPAEVEELRAAGEGPSDFVQRLALDKARAVASGRPEAAVLGCDTIVEVDGEILGKPIDEAEARDMLRALSGREHRVHSAAALVCNAIPFARASEQISRVRFRALDAAEIARYVETGEPLDKAGSYGIQGQGAMLVASIEGCYFNVMGLPLLALRELWNELAASEPKERS